MDSMPNCCSCNSSGCCKNCSCVKKRRPCSSCLPSRLSKCSNRSMTPINAPQSQTSSTSSMLPQAQPPALALVHDSEDPQPTILITTPDREPQCLPPFRPLTKPNFVWSDTMDAESFSHAITSAYAETVHWHRNLFLVPSGKAGTSFITLLAKLFCAYGEGSSLESIALRAAMGMPVLLLQKPHARSKTYEHVTSLERRPASWQRDDIDTLVQEGRTIQKRFHLTSTSNDSNHKQHKTRKIAKLMSQGKVKAALQLLEKTNSGGVLPLNSTITTNLHSIQPTPCTVREVLIEKHPPG